MITILSLVTSVKDYVEIIHKLIETDSSLKITNYSEISTPCFTTTTAASTPSKWLMSTETNSS